MSEKKKMIAKAVRNTKKNLGAMKREKKLPSIKLPAAKDNIQILKVEIKTPEDDKDWSKIQNPVENNFEIYVDLIYNGNYMKVRGAGISKTEERHESFCIFLNRFYLKIIPDTIYNFVKFFCENLFFQVLPKKEIPVKKWRDLK